MAALFHALWNFVVRKVYGDLTVLWLALCSACFLFLPPLLYVVLNCNALEQINSSFGYVIGTGILHALYFILLSRAYKYFEISTVYPIARGTGVGLTAIFAWILLKEEFSFAGLLGVCLIITGILIFSLQSCKGLRKMTGLNESFCVGIIIAAYSLIDKNGVNRTHPILYIWLMCLISLAIIGPIVIHHNQFKISNVFRRYKKYIFSIGLGSIGTYLMILYAFKKGPASYIVASRESSVIVGALLGFIFLKEKPSFYKILAITAITAGLVCIKLV